MGNCDHRRIHDEVRVVADSPRLSALTAKTVGKALQLMAEKAEYMTFAGVLSAKQSDRFHCIPCLQLCCMFTLYTDCKQWDVSCYPAHGKGNKSCNNFIMAM